MIARLQTDKVTLFDLVSDSRKDIREANDGAAMAFVLDAPSVPAGARFALPGWITRRWQPGQAQPAARA